jgi:hypothetical protein
VDINAAEQAVRNNDRGRPLFHDRGLLDQLSLLHSRRPAGLKAATMSKSNQLLITLVHGTWPHGFFPRYARFKLAVRNLMRNLIRRERQDRPPYWYENKSSFLARLRAELGDIPYKITPLLWSGENSIRVRDETSHILAERLLAEHAEYPQATQLVIAHSHGGNILFRALYHLQQRNALQSGAKTLVVTLATPFVEIHQADFGKRPELVRTAFVGAIWYILYLLALEVFRLSMTSMVIFLLATGLPLAFVDWYWIRWRRTARQKLVQSLRSATKLGAVAPTQPLLVIRAIDDEASLILGCGRDR